MTVSNKRQSQMNEMVMLLYIDINIWFVNTAKAIEKHNFKMRTESFASFDIIVVYYSASYIDV